MIPLKPLPPRIQSPAFQLTAKQAIERSLFTPTEIEGYKFPEGLYGVLLKGGTGVGKTYILLSLVRDNLSRITIPEGSINPFRVLYLLPGNAKIQIQRAIEEYGLTNYIHTLSYGELRSKNSPYILWETKTDETGKDININPYWNPIMLPGMIIVDECQVARNEGSKTSRILCNIPTHTMGVKIIPTSATAFGRISEARFFMVTCGVITPFNRLPIVNEVYPSVAHELCVRGKDPWDHSPGNMKNLVTNCAPWIVEVKNARFKHKAITNLISLEFRDDEQRNKYSEVYEEYKAKMRSLNKDRGYFDSGMIVEKWVALLKFRQAAELLRIPQLSEHAIEKIKNGKQVIIASNFIDTLRGCWKTLVKEFGISKDRIGFIIRGQNPSERQVIVDKWQRGELDYLLLTMKAGGVALSLHHDNEISRPRAIILPPTYGAPEFVQVIGRVLRFTSISDVEQAVLWFNNTVESNKVLPRIAIKLKCLDAAVSAKEQWGHMFEKFVMDEDKSEDTPSEELLEEQYGVMYKQENTSEITEDGTYKTEEGELELIGGEMLVNQDQS